MKGDPVRALVSAPAAATTRGLSTARSVLRVLSLLVEHPAGIRADEVAQALGKSISTAYYLLASLCEEGFAVHEAKGVYRPAQSLEEPSELNGNGNGDAHASENGGADDGRLADTVEELFLRTRRRSYLGEVRNGCVEITAFRGRQGVPRIPGLGSEIRDSMHALAMGKVVLSRLGDPGLSRYVAAGLPAFTRHTISSPRALGDELARVRTDGYAVDREEFDENFCCIAAPIEDDHGRFVAVLGLSMSPSRFDADRDALAAVVTDVAHSATPVASQRLTPTRARRMAAVR